MGKIRRVILNPINLLSMSRVVWAGLTIAFLGTWWSFLFLGLGMFSDFLDGTLSRKYKMTTEEGATIDGVVDKVFFAAIFVALFIKLDLPLWYVPLVFVRDIVNFLAGVLILLFMRGKKFSFKARWSGKIVTIFQFAFLLAFMLEKSEFYYPLALMVFVLSVWSVVDYGYGALRTWRPARGEPNAPENTR